MKLITDEISRYLTNSSGIRKMFEAGLELKKRYGADKVYDFSLGNPDLPPPSEVGDALRRIADKAASPLALGYMPNAGYPALREKLAVKLSREQKCELGAGNVVVTCGAAGAINILFRAVLESGDEVVTPSPYFVEYDFYAANFGGKLVAVPSRDFTFELDVPALAAAINAKTRAVILNSPHNPTGRIYRREELAELGEAVAAAERRFGRPIYVVADEPYRFLNFDGLEIPSLYEFFEHSVVIGSFSKSLSLAGERIGYIAVNPAMENGAELINALILCNRILGFVNAPAVAQQILLECLDAEVELGVYRARRDAAAEVLGGAGIEFCLPSGAFYFFARSPVADERELIEALLAEQILVVPGRAFGRAGYFRMTFCVDEKVIRAAGPGFRRAVAKLKK
ncbi:MAG: pyridoxal phosphate-dependent aminotransferase [Victivallaceae bacterium]